MAEPYELLDKGFSCSEVIMANMLDHLGQSDETLIRAMRGLERGMGIRHACGIVTAAACAFTLTEAPHHAMFMEFYNWFLFTYGQETDGILCAALLRGDPDNAQQVCPDMIAMSWRKMQEILNRLAVNPS